MLHQRNRYSAEFKVKVALAVLTESKTLTELASEYQSRNSLTNYTEQPSIHDVMARKTVHDVVALNS